MILHAIAEELANQTAVALGLVPVPLRYLYRLARPRLTAWLRDFALTEIDQ